MNVDDYQQEAMSLLNPALNPQDVLENALMGLCGESGISVWKISGSYSRKK